MDRKLRVTYKIMRRRGFGRGEPALKEARAMVIRLTGAIAVMDASDWKADPLRVARQAHAIG